MTDHTHNLKLPYLLPSQAQKHVTYNETLRYLDAIIQATVISQVDDLPADPLEGESYLISAAPAADLTLWAHHLAIYVDGAWMYHAPNLGWQVYDLSLQQAQMFNGAEWFPLDFPKLAIREALSINATPDTSNRLTVKSDRSLFDYETTDHRLKINKANETDVASIVLQSAYQGRAEIGLVGNNNLQILVNDNGPNFTSALVIDQASGDVSFPQGIDRDVMMNSVFSAGGMDTVMGPPNLVTSSQGRGETPIIMNRVYFAAIYIDRPTMLTGLAVSQSQASQTSGAIMRAGLFHIGEAAGNNWNVGDLIADLGTQSATSSGHKAFDAPTDVALEKGWYLTALVTNGAGVSLRYCKWSTPGLLQYSLVGSGDNADFKTVGMGYYLHDTVAETIVTSGFQPVWQGNPVIDASSADDTVLQLAVPVWRRWNAPPI